MAITSSRLLLNLGVFRADTVRTSLGAYACNFTTQDGSINTTSYKLAPGQIVTFVPPTGMASVLILVTNQKLRVDVTLGEVEREVDGVMTVDRAETTSTLYPSKLLMLDDSITSLVIENTSTTATASVNVFQG